MTEVEEIRIWGIHTKDDSLFLNENKIAIGWREFGDLSKVDNNREAFKKRYCKCIPTPKRAPFRQARECCIVLFMKSKSEIMLYFRPKAIE